MFIKPKKKGWISGPAAFYKAAAGGGAAAYSYIGAFSNNAGLPAGASYNIPVTMAGSGGLLVIFAAVQNVFTVSSVVYDPGGANVTLTQDTFSSASGNSIGMWSGVVPAFTGAKNVTVTYSASVQFLAAGAHAYLATNLLSGVKQSAAVGSNSITLSATAGHFMFAASFGIGSFTGIDYATSTQLPANIHADADTNSYAADWTISSTNASFSVVPKAAAGYGVAAATYH